MNRTAKLPWALFAGVWLVLGCLMLVPRFKDGYLYDACPLLLLYVVWAVSAPAKLLASLWWPIAHLVAAVGLTALVSSAWRRLSRAHRRVAGAVVLVALVGGVSWAVSSCWPDGVYFDAETIHYDVSDLLEPEDRAGEFHEAQDVVDELSSRLMARAELYGPHFMLGFDDGTFVGWGTWPQHMHLRSELESLRAE